MILLFVARYIIVEHQYRGEVFRVRKIESSKAIRYWIPVSNFYKNAQFDCVSYLVYNNGKVI